MRNGISFFAVVMAAALVLPGTAFSESDKKADQHPKEGREQKDGPRGKTSSRERKEGPREKMSNLDTDDILERLTDRLELREDQQKKIRAVLEKAKPDMEQLEKDLRKVREKMREAMFRTKEGIRETLDMDQKENFDRIAMRLMMGRGQGGMMGGGRGMMGSHGEPGMRGGPEMMESRGMRRGMDGPPMREEREVRIHREGPQPREGDDD